MSCARRWSRCARDVFIGEDDDKWEGFHFVQLDDDDDVRLRARLLVAMMMLMMLKLALEETEIVIIGSINAEDANNNVILYV